MQRGNNFRQIYWFYWIKYINLFKIKATGCYDINVTFISSSKDGLLKFAIFEFRHVYAKLGKLFGKNTARFCHNNACMVNLFVCRYK